MPSLCKLGDVFFTVVEEESITYSNDVTEKSVESGENISDHVANQPVKIRLTGLVFDNKGYPQELLTRLRLYSLNKEVLRYIGVQTYSNMVIESFENIHNKDIAHGISFTMSLKQVRVASKVTVNINTSKYSIPDIEKLKEQMQQNKTQNKTAAKAKAKPKTNKGRQTKKPKAKKSVLEKIKSKY